MVIMEDGEYQLDYFIDEKLFYSGFGFGCFKQEAYSLSRYFLIYKDPFCRTIYGLNFIFRSICEYTRT